MSALDLSLRPGTWDGHIPVALRRAAWQTLQTLKIFSINITLHAFEQKIDIVHKHLRQLSNNQTTIAWTIMFTKLRMIFILDIVRLCQKAQIKALSLVKIAYKQHLNIFELEQWGKYKLIYIYWARME